MKRAILIVLVMFLVVSGAFAAPVTVGGKLEAKAEIGIGGNNPLKTSPGIETDLKLAVDDYNSATVKLRAQGGLTADVPASNITSNGVTVGTIAGVKATVSNGTAANGSLVRFDELVLESDLGGQFGLAEATGGLSLKFKGGFFNPNPSEKGEIKTIVESINTISGDSAANGAATLLTVGWLDLVNVYGGIEIPTASSPLNDAQIGFVVGANGDIQAGPGTLGYAVYFRDIDTTVDGTEVGAGVEYKGIDVGGGLLNIGLGGQFAYKLGLASDAMHTILFGTSLGIGVLNNAIELDIDHSGSLDTALQKIGVGLKLSMPELGGLSAGTLSATVKFEGDHVPEVAATATTPKKDARLKLALDVGLTAKAGATSFTLGLDANDFDDFDSSNVYLTASLGY